jgi:Tol biopolymer transport system component
MGEVYRAHDARLGRDVAVKVLPADVSTDPDRLRRFEQEARAAAALNHPGILAVYDIGVSEAAGATSAVAYIVTELLDGRTLREALTAERLAISRTVDLAAQIADGLAAAHARGIVHRDVKPENIFVTVDGHAKLLDFGLAKTVDAAAVAQASTQSATAPHTVLGTAGYMAPEQVRAQPVDHRTDIFAFGAVLYEMLSGRRAFSGDTAFDTMNAILRDAPASVPGTGDRPIPPALSRIVERCLEKAPAARFQSTIDLAFALKTISHGDTSAAMPLAPALPPIAASRAWRERVAWGLAAMSTLALAGTVAVSLRRPAPEPPPTIRFTVPPPQGARIDIGGGVAISISPDGTQIVFGARAGDRALPSLWVRDLASFEARQVASAGNIAQNAGPFWSPDGRAVGFWTGGKLRRVDLDSGVVTIIGDAPPVSGPAWGPDGTIIFGSQLGANADAGSGIFRIPAAGGSPRLPVTRPDVAKGEGVHSRPSFLPDGRHFVFIAVPQKICVGSLDSPDVKPILDADSQAVYAQGYLLFVRQTTLVAQRFDTTRLETVGDAVAIADNVRTSSRLGVAQFAVSANGVLIYQTGDVSDQEPLAWFDRAGRPSATVPDSLASYLDIALFPDARHALASIYGTTRGAGSDLWTVDLERGTRLRVTSDPGVDVRPVVSPDGTRVLWASQRASTANARRLFWKRTDGVGPDELVMDSERGQTPTDWSNHWIVFSTGPTRTNFDVWVAPDSDPAKAKPYLQTDQPEDEARLSPDGHWMAYVSTESGVRQVYVRPFPEASGGRWLMSAAEGGGRPHWRADGREIIYVAPGGRLMAVPIAFGPRGVEPGAARFLFQSNSVGWDVTRDHARFLMTVPVTDTTRNTPLRVVVNWTSLIARK